MDAPKCVEYVYPGATKQAVPHPLELTAHASHQYYEPRDGFSILGIFKNPMLLMMVVMGGMMFMMPKMMENLDPEEKELKIVQAESSKRAELAAQQRIEEEKARLASMRTLEGVKALSVSKYSLAERYASVYDDPLMNLYGVPPPGQPKLFYGRDGGTTMDLAQA